MGRSLRKYSAYWMKACTMYIHWVYSFLSTLHWKKMQQTKHCQGLNNPTRLPSNTDHLRMCTFSYTWSLPVTWQRWRSHKLICRSRKSHATRKVHSSMFYRTGVIADRSFTWREKEFSIFLAPVTLTLTRWPSYTNLTRRSWRYTACVKMNFLCQGFWKLLSDRHTYTQTDTTKTSRVVEIRVLNTQMPTCTV